MYCEQCGTKIEEGANFCTSCGNHMNTGSGDEMQPPPKKRRCFSQRVLAVLAILLVVGVIAASAKDAVMLKAAPGVYIGNLLENTFSRIADEYAKSSERLMGFSSTDANGCTVELEGKIDSAPTEELEGFGASVRAGISEKDREAAGSFSLLKDDEDIITADCFINDESMGLKIPQIADECWVVPSKEFGKAWNSSGLRDYLDGGRISEDIDLSFSNLFGRERFTLTKESMEEIKELSKELFGGIKVVNTDGDRADINGKEVRVKRIDAELDGGEIRDYIVSVIRVYKNDENIKSYLDSFDFSELTDGEIPDADEIFDELVNIIKDELDIDGNADISIYEYRNKIARLKLECVLEADGDEVELDYSMAFGDSKNLIDNIDAELTVTVDGESAEIIFTSEGNHMLSGNVYSDNTTIEIRSSYDESIIFEKNMECDFKKGTASGEITLSAEDEFDASIEYSGKCSNSKGFEFILDDVCISADDGYDSFDISGSLSLKIRSGMHMDEIDKSDCAELFEMSESEAERYFEKLSESDKMEELEEKLDELYF